MLETKDIEIIRTVVYEVVRDVVDQKLDKRDKEWSETLDARDERWEQHLDDRLEKAFAEKLAPINEHLEHLDRKTDLILDEVVRVHEGLLSKMDDIEKEMKDMRQYYRIDKLENDNMSLVLELIRDLESKIA